jgi:hypothetical protein
MMKKSAYIKLVLVATAFSACHQPKKEPEKQVFMRSDTTAHYSRAHGMGFLGYYYAFRPYGIYSMGRGFSRAGYYSGAIREGSNVGSNGFKGTVVRGGFGSSVFHASS